MLNIAVLSDIHGNYVALQKCLDHALCIEIDTFMNLTQKDLQFFKSLSFKNNLKFNGLPQLTICHGSPRKVNEDLTPDTENTFSIMEDNPGNYILCGHTHRQGKIEHNQKLVLNAGSVGVPLQSSGKAQFMILSGAQNMWNYEFVSLEYDIESIIADLHSSGLSQKAPYWCKISENLLRTGEGSHGTFLGRAMALCKDKYGKCNWPNIPEECWEQAVKELNL